MIAHALDANALLVAFAVVGTIMAVAGWMSRRLTFGRIHGSAIAILVGLALAFFGGWKTGGRNALADLPMMSGFGLMGRAMLRDFAIVATAFEVDVVRARQAGWIGAVALGLGTVLPFVVGTLIAYAYGYHDAVSVTTVAAGAITYIVGPVTGTAPGASSAVIALSIATGVLKAVLMMVGTPLVATLIRLDNPRSAMVFGGLMGTVSACRAGWPQPIAGWCLMARSRRLSTPGSPAWWRHRCSTSLARPRWVDDRRRDDE